MVPGHIPDNAVTFKSNVNDLCTRQLNAKIMIVERYCLPTDGNKFNVNVTAHCAMTAKECMNRMECGTWIQAPDNSNILSP
jgi:hypothetical protein